MSLTSAVAQICFNLAYKVKFHHWDLGPTFGEIYDQDVIIWTALFFKCQILVNYVKHVTMPTIC